MENSDTAVSYVSHLDSFALSTKVEGMRPHAITCYVREARRLGERTGWIPPRLNSNPPTSVITSIGSQGESYRRQLLAHNSAGAGSSGSRLMSRRSRATQVQRSS